MPPSAIANSIAAKTHDYREGEWAGMNPQHVDRWAAQFDAAVREPLLAELDHLLDAVYVSKSKMAGFLSEVARDEDLTGGKPEGFWRGAGVLDIQLLGSSQKEMLGAFDATLRAAVGFGLDGCWGSSGTFVYLDDASFSGGHLKNDLGAWLPKAPATCHIHVVVFGLHAYGKYLAEKEITALAKAAGKTITFTFWRKITFEDRMYYSATSDVLRPNALPLGPHVDSYVEQITGAGYPPKLRTGNSIGDARLYSSPAGRVLMEQQMLIKGAYLRSVCRNLKTAHRPLGYLGFHGLGFGGLLVTYRNCANNCPLPYWAGDPWYPLFPRRTNAQSAAARNGH